MKYWVILILIFCFKSFAQINILQDDSSIEWKKLENDYFEVIYPDHVEDQAQYILQLLNHYRSKVSKTYNYQSQKISLVLRPNSADPNGFVTLAPRRSEWFMSAAYSPFVGSLEWYQTLAVHEYRHVVQFDFLNRSNTKIGYVFGGESILGALLGLSIPNWFFEGDAVWVETVNSDAGRGRSPRFSARLKSLISNNYPLTFDQLLAGDFNIPTPNHYVFGYFFITRAIVMWGEDFWYHVAARATDEPLNPYALYDAFYEVSGIPFDQFYQDTVTDLKMNWGDNPTLIPIGEYKSEQWPHKEKEKLYYLHKDVNHFWRLMEKSSEGEKALTELNVYPSMSKVDFKNSHLVYTQSLPHFRYAYKNYSDIFFYHIDENEHYQITFGKRFYHPQFNAKGDKIVATEYTDTNQWHLVVLNHEGEELERIPSTKNSKLIEAVWRDEDNLIALSLNPQGMKEIVTINLQSKLITPISPATRNNIYSLHVDGQDIYFEADDLGSVNIFKYNLDKEEFFKCSEEFIAAYNVGTTAEKIMFSAQDVNGLTLKEIPKECRPIQKADLFKNYLGNTPSDNYTKSPAVIIENFENLKNQKIPSDQYPELKSALTPHSWSFIGGRGYQVSVTSANTLGTLALNAYAGKYAEENTPFAGLSAIYAKYLPIFSFGIDHSKRKILLNNEDVSWDETSARFQMTLPYFYQVGLHNGSQILNLFIDRIIVGEKDQVKESFELNDQNLTAQGFDFQITNTKSKLPKELFPKIGAELNYFYEDLRTSGSGENISYLGGYQLNMYIPGLLNLHGLRLTTSGEYRPDDKDLYRQQRQYAPIIGYSFSRGYAYEFTPRFNKYTLDYAFTLGYPNWGFGDWIYFNRIYTQLFVDHTLSEYSDGDRSLNSFGSEIMFNSLTFRKFPISYGLRILKRVQDDSNHVEFFLSL